MVSLVLAFSVSSFSTHFGSGMDTAFVLCFATFYVLIIQWHRRKLSPGSSVLAGIAGGLTFGVRPDLVIYAVVVPLATLLLAASKKERWAACAVLAISGLLIGAQMGLANAYFSSLLPLSFYVKSGRMYGAAIYQYYAAFSRNELFIFFRTYQLFFLCIGLDLLLHWRRWIRPSAAVEIGLLAASLIFILYYLFFVLPIMGFFQRFYMPTLPVFIFLACRSGASLAGDLVRRIAQSAAWHKSIRALPGRCWLLAGLVLASFLPLSPVRATVSAMLSRNVHFDITTDYHDKSCACWKRRTSIRPHAVICNAGKGTGRSMIHFFSAPLRKEHLFAFSLQRLPLCGGILF